MPHITRVFFAVVLSGSVLPASASAAIISVDHATFGVGALTRDTAQGLDFLDLTWSTNRSYDDVSMEFGIGGDFEGFRYATRSEVADLINNWGFSPGVVDQPVIGDTGGDQLSGLVDLLGNNDRGFDPSYRWASGATGTFIAANAVSVIAIVDRTSPSTDDNVAGVAGGVFVGLAQVDAGSFLVQNSAAVPEPSSFALLGMAAMGGAAYRRRKHKLAR